MSELLMWFRRVVEFLPEIMGLYEAVQRDDETAKLNASLALMRAMKDEQAKAEMGP